MSTILRTALLAILALAARAGETLLAVDFSTPGPDQAISAKGSFRGPLPVGAAPDFPGWNGSQVVGTAMEEGGRRFLRLDVKKREQSVLFRMPGTPMRLEPGYYELRVTARTAARPLNLHLRLVPAPYSTLCEADTPVGPDWQEHSFILQLKVERNYLTNVQPDLSRLGLYLSLGSGVTDIAALSLLRSDRDAYIARHSVGIRRAPAGLPNLLRSSRFPRPKAALPLRFP